jgi:protein TonB
MTIAYPDWSSEVHFLERVPRPRHRWKSMAVSVIGHGALLYALLYVSLSVPKQAEMQSITVSIAAAQASKSEPPPAPKLEATPLVVQPSLPQIDTVALPSSNSISAAPPPPQTPAETTGADEAPVAPPRYDAAYLNNPLPIYPNLSRRLRETGVVQLRVRVSAAGEPMEIQLFKSSGFARLDDSARAAVQKWKFQPALRNGNALEAWVIVPLDFSLDKAGR